MYVHTYKSANRSNFNVNEIFNTTTYFLLTGRTRTATFIFDMTIQFHTFLKTNNPLKLGIK